MSKPAQPRRRHGRMALLVGLGALSAAAAGGGTEAARPDPGFSREPAVTLGDVVLVNDGDRLLLSEGGGEFRPIDGGDSAAARHLMALLQRGDTAGNGVRLQPTILAGDGGAGFHWTPSEKPTTRKAGAVKTRGQVRPAPEGGTPGASSSGERGAKG